MKHEKCRYTAYIKAFGVKYSVKRLILGHISSFRQVLYLNFTKVEVSYLTTKNEIGLFAIKILLTSLHFLPLGLFKQNDKKKRP